MRVGSATIRVGPGCACARLHRTWCRSATSSRGFSTIAGPSSEGRKRVTGPAVAWSGSTPGPRRTDGDSDRPTGARPPAGICCSHGDNAPSDSCPTASSQEPFPRSTEIAGRSASSWRKVVDLPAGRQVRDPYGEAVATRAGPACPPKPRRRWEPWRCGGDAVTQASAALRCDSGRFGVRAGWVWSRERT